MRIPLNKVYRAFPELDQLSDEQCELLMKRVQLGTGVNLGLHALFVGVFLILLVVSVTAINLFGIFVLGPDTIPKQYEMFGSVIALLIGLGFPAAATMLLRDMILRRRLSRAIHYEIERIRCLHCKYILIGQVPSGGYVGCPECGASFRLGELGLTEEDLIPPPGGVEA